MPGTLFIVRKNLLQQGKRLKCKKNVQDIFLPGCVEFIPLFSSI